MATRFPARRPAGKQSEALGLKLLPIKGTPELHRRLKIAAAEEGLSYAQLLTIFLDRREANIQRQRAAQVSPLHRPRNLEQLAQED